MQLLSAVSHFCYLSELSVLLVVPASVLSLFFSPLHLQPPWKMALGIPSNCQIEHGMHHSREKSKLWVT